MLLLVPGLQPAIGPARQSLRHAAAVRVIGSWITGVDASPRICRSGAMPHRVISVTAYPPVPPAGGAFTCLPFRFSLFMDLTVYLSQTATLKCFPSALPLYLCLSDAGLYPVGNDGLFGCDVLCVSLLSEFQRFLKRAGGGGRALLSSRRSRTRGTARFFRREVI